MSYSILLVHCQCNQRYNIHSFTLYMANWVLMQLKTAHKTHIANVKLLHELHNQVLHTTIFISCSVPTSPGNFGTNFHLCKKSYIFQVWDLLGPCLSWWFGISLESKGKFFHCFKFSSFCFCCTLSHTVSIHCSALLDILGCTMYILIISEISLGLKAEDINDATSLSTYISLFKKLDLERNLTHKSNLPLCI